nr:thioredoxin family protein [Roseateles sp. DAIF2]
MVPGAGLRGLLPQGQQALTRQSDQLARERRALPWVRIDKPYRFDTPAGPRTLAELFEGRSQLLVQHFMLGPGWEAGCPSCSFMADHADGMLDHLAQRNVTLLAVSRAPLAEIERFKHRMGWRFGWASSAGSDFNYDFCVSFTPEQCAQGEVYYNYGLEPSTQQELPGISAFYRDAEGQVYHSYSTYGRGVEAMIGTYRLLDLAPRGRDEDALPYGMAWVRHHDRYGAPATSSSSSCGCAAAAQG